jgi:hypothetical protein
MPSRSPAGDERGSVPAWFGSEQGVGQRRFSPAGEREPTRGSPTEERFDVSAESEIDQDAEF